MQRGSRPPKKPRLSVVAAGREVEISIVVPAFCEQASLPGTLSAIKDVMAKGCHYEVIVVDDGSTDDTWAVLTDHAHHDKHLRAIRLSRNFGKEAAISAGLEHAAGRAVVVMDADLQHPPRVIADMIALWRAGHDVVNGVKETGRAEPMLRNLTTRTFSGLFRGVSGLDMTRASDFKLLDRRVARALLKIPERDRFFRGLVAWTGFDQTSVTFPVSHRAAGKSRFSLWRR